MCRPPDRKSYCGKRDDDTLYSCVWCGFKIYPYLQTIALHSDCTLLSTYICPAGMMMDNMTDDASLCPQHPFPIQVTAIHLTGRSCRTPISRQAESKDPLRLATVINKQSLICKVHAVDLYQTTYSKPRSLVTFVVLDSDPWLESRTFDL